MVLGLSRRSGAKAVAASAGGSQAILAMDLSCYRLSGWMKWWSTTPMPVAAAAPGDRESSDHSDCDRASAAPLGVPLLLHLHLRFVAAGCGGQSLWAQAQRPGGFADGVFPLEFQQSAAAPRLTSEGGGLLRRRLRLQPRGTLRHAPASQYRAGSGHLRSPSGGTATTRGLRRRRRLARSA